MSDSNNSNYKTNCFSFTYVTVNSKDFAVECLRQHSTHFLIFDFKVLSINFKVKSAVNRHSNNVLSVNSDTHSCKTVLQCRHCKVLSLLKNFLSSFLSLHTQSNRYTFKVSVVNTVIILNYYLFKTSSLLLTRTLNISVWKNAFFYTNDTKRQSWPSKPLISLYTAP